MKIGDRVFVHGYVDEIRKDTIIIRNNGGYFGTDKSEVIAGELPEQKTGHWLIRKFGDCAKCSECGMSFADIYDMDNADRYCRHCGSKMYGLRVQI